MTFPGQSYLKRFTEHPPEEGVGKSPLALWARPPKPMAKEGEGQG